MSSDESKLDPPSNKEEMATLLNLIAYQAAWFAAVLGAARGLPWVGALAIAAAILLHLVRVPRARPELVLILAAGLIGAVLDSLLVLSGWVAYPSGMLIEGLAPYWMVAMWMLFATTLNVSLSWLKRRRATAALFGLLGGPLAYFAGERLGGISLDPLSPALISIALGWAVAMPLLTILAERFDGVAARELKAEAAV